MLYDIIVRFGNEVFFLNLKVVRGEFDGFFIIKQIEQP